MQNNEFLNNSNQRVSLKMSDLLSSNTFLETFSAKNRKERSIMKNLMFRIQRIMNDKFVEIAGSKSIEQIPEMIIKYLENSLVFITNDAERPTQVIKFSQKEELTVVIVIIILTMDLMLGKKNENRFYFLMDMFSKL
jgi:ABC-type iron transport system FetAB ATPase subunit